MLSLECGWMSLNIIERETERERDRQTERPLYQYLHPVSLPHPKQALPSYKLDLHDVIAMSQAVQWMGYCTVR
jgi:hypothetical protein